MEDTKPRLADEDWDELEAWLDAIESGRFQRTMGLLHGIAVAPSPLVPSRWLPLVVTGHSFSDQHEATKWISLVMRAASEVRYLISMDRTYAPDETSDADDVAAFATGYLVATDLDDSWKASDESRAYATAFLPLVATAKPEDFGVDAEELESRRGALRGRMGDVIVATHHTFAAAAEGTTPHNRRGPVRNARVGRNDPCSCGSGKKWKKCCGGVASA